jgi:DNA-binding transcriptional LysR family regulator
VSQPAVTKQIKNFEEFCNLKLFRKKRAKVYLTDEGKKIFIYASRIFELERQLEETISGLQNLKRGTLSIGTTKTYARYFMPVSLDMSKSLLDFKNSLTIVAKVEENPDILFIPLLLEEVVLIVAPNHHLAKRDKITFRDLNEEPIIMKEIGSGTRDLVERYARREKIRLTVVAQTSNMEFIKQLVKQEQAVSFVVRSSVETELSKSELISVPVRPQNLFLKIFIAYLRDYELPFAARAFLDYLLSFTHPKNLSVGVDPFVKKIETMASKKHHQISRRL